MAQEVIIVDAGGGGYVTPKQYTATFSIAYYPKYSDVTNVSNGTSVSDTVSTTGSPGSAALSQKVTSTIPTRTGYTFLGWRVDDNDSKSLYSPGQQIDVYVQYGASYTLKLYTRWSINTNSIIYYGNGGSEAPSSQTKNYGSTIYLSSSAPTRTGYVFVNWNTAANGTGTSYSPGQAYSTNADLTLYAIWRAAASVPSLNTQSANIGTAITIYTNRVSSNAVHTLKYSFAGVSGVIAENVSTSYSWTIPTSFYNLLPNSTTGTCTVTCDTYISGTKSGSTQSVQFNVNVPDTIKPTITVSTSVVNEGNVASIIGNSIVQGYSKISFSLSSTPGTGASFSSFSISGPNLPSNLSNTASTIVTNILSSSGPNTWTVYATDSRGRTSTVNTVQISVSAYARPNISPISMHRCDQNGNQDASSGTYLTTRAFYGASNVGANSITSAKVYYRRAGVESGSWTLGVDLTNEAASGSGLWTSPFGSGNIAIEYSYEVKYEVQDSIGVATNQQASDIISYPMPSGAGVSMGIYNDRVRLGGLVEESGFVVDWASKFRNVLAIQNLNAFGMECTIAGEGDNMSLLLTGNK